MHKKRFKNWVRMFILITSISLTTLLLFISTVLLYRSYNPSVRNKNLLVSYNSEDSISYKIKTNDNQFYLDDQLDMDKEYISSIIDKINFNVSYKFESSKTLNYEYNYSIIATLISNYNVDNSNKEIWKKEFIIVPETNMLVEEDNFIEINKDFEIEYQTFNDIMKAFKKEFDLDVNAYLNIDFNINLKSDSLENNSIIENNNINIQIPLLSNTTSIKYIKDGIKNNSIWTTVKDMESTSIIVKIIYGLVAILSFILDSLLLMKVYSITKKDRFYYESNKILKSYSDLLVKVDEMPGYLELKNINVSNFEDMIDVNDELHLPILYFEEENKITFFIMSDSHYYVYKLKRNI